MPDISMCSDKDCPSAECCYRFMATPSPFLQAYGKFNRENGASKCGHFWPVKGASERRRLDRALD